MWQLFCSILQMYSEFTSRAKKQEASSWHRSFGQRVGIGDTLDSSSVSTPHHVSTQHGAQPPLLVLVSDVRTLRVELSSRCILRARGTPTVATGHGEPAHPGSPRRSGKAAGTEYTMQASYNIPHAACHFRAPHLTCLRHHIYNPSFKKPR